MALTKVQIDLIRKRAKERGLSEQEISQGIARLNQQSVRQDVTPQQPQQPGGMSSVNSVGETQPQQTGGLVGSFFKSLYQPFESVGQTVAEAQNVIRTPGMVKSALGGKLNEREQAAVAGYKPRYLKKEDLSRGALAKRAVKQTAGVASYAVPFGKGAGIVSKALAPGAASAGLLEASQEDATVGSVGKAAALGAATAGAIQGIGGMLSWARGKSGSLTRSGKALQAGTRKIKTKASVYGAKSEKTINQTLDKYKFKGTAQQQYENLEPTIQKIEKDIQKLIEESPKIAVSKEQIKQSFIKNLASSIRSSEITQKQAVKEINGYLNDLLRAAGERGASTGQPLIKAGAKDIPLSVLRSLKKLVNADYGTIYTKLTNGTPLTPREKVINAAWKSLDDAVKNASPKLKGFLRDESNLYNAARSLSAARFNPPTLRIAGTSVPAEITQKGRDVLTGGLERTGKVAGKLPSKLIPENMTGLAVMGISQAFLENEATETNNYGISDNVLDEISPGEVGVVGSPSSGLVKKSEKGLADQPGYAAEEDQAEEQISHDSTIQQGVNLQQQYQSKKPFGGRSKRELLLLALSQGASKSDLKEISDIYDMVTEEGEPELELSDSAIKNVTDLEGAIEDAEGLYQSISQSDLVGPIKGLAAKSPYAEKSRSLQAEIDRVRQVIGKALEGGVLRKEDEEKYKKILPTMTDTKEVALEKLNKLYDKLNDDLELYVKLQRQHGKGRGIENIIPKETEELE